MQVGSRNRPLRVAIVGSGPAGFYAAAALLKQDEVGVEVDVLDRLPTPYGLVRGGVAPDHQKIKSVVRVYERAAADPAFGFFGNVELGRDVQVADLLACYDQVVFALGNEADRRMGIPGETLEGCTPATVFVGWYNAHPDFRDADLDFDCRRVAIVGNGNVAIDVARILARSTDELRATDIAEHALRPLADSRVEEIVILGRRGPVQAAFTPAELNELTRLEHAVCVVDPADLELDAASRAALDEASEKSPAARNYATLREIAGRPVPPGRTTLRLRFLVSPVEIRGDDRGRVRTIVLERNELVADESGAIRARGTGQREELEVGRVFVSIGYQGRRTPGVPFDERRGLIPNEDGRVLAAADGAVVPRHYVVGWAKSGPRGLIGMHKEASAGVVRLMLQDVAAGTVASGERGGRESLVALLRERGVEFVPFDEWQRLDAMEIERGKQRGAPRSKFGSIPEMLEALEDTAEAD